MASEAKARITIDQKLAEAGYILQDYKTELNPRAALGVVVREFPTRSGPVDYLVFINSDPVGVIEAKATNKAESITTVAEQSKRYAESGLVGMSEIPDIRFAYEATDEITCFTDYHDQKARSREVFSFHRPETLQQWMAQEDTLRNRMKAFPPFDSTGFRDCQTNAIVNLEQSFTENRPRALIQMATGAGKTYTAITSAYRLLKHAKASRILFLVDTKNLGEQAEQEFLKYQPTDDARLFPDLYPVCRLKNSYIPDETKVCISTIQRMYSILRGEELDESAEETSLNEINEDVQENKAREHFSLAEDVEPTDEQLNTAQDLLADEVVSPFFKPEVRDFLENARKNHDQIIDHTNIDKLEFAGWDTDQEEKAEKAIQTFRQFIEDNRNEIEALNIIYSQSYKQRPLTLKMVKELYAVLQKPPYRLSNEMLWSAYVIKRGDKVKAKGVVNKLADIISLIRFELGYSQELNVFSAEIALKFQSWIFAKNAGHIHFTKEQMEWLHDIRDHVAVSMQITKEDLEYTPFDNKGGLGRFYDLFGAGYKELLEEINDALVA